jgi:UDP-N-acetylmuramyl pentapeptide phosphotransferase/UDP-N-acetylglucosamine-1-phosphate transferase
MNISSISSVLAVTVLLLLATAGLMVSHVRSWRAFQQEESDVEELDYRRRQFRRRMQTSAMLGILGVAILVGYILTLWLSSPAFTVVFWIAIILVLFWTCLLALVDMWATKHHFSRLRDHCLVEQAKLRAEINRIQAFRGNGKGKHPAREPKSEGREDAAP